MEKKIICKDCKSQFSLSEDDLNFFAKMKVPFPTRCHDCQTQRRMSFRGERALHKRTESLRGGSIISQYAPETDITVFTQKEWWGDSWDPTSYGKEYDFSSPFFKQFKELSRRVPWPTLLNWNAVESDYCNYTTDNKNCYLVFGGDYNESCSYSTFCFHSKDSSELYWVDKCELCYELIYSDNCFNVSHAQYCNNCTDSLFLYNCVNCHDCLGCVNLKSAAYCILNVQYSKEEYQQKLKEYLLGSRKGREDFSLRFKKLKLTLPHRYAEIHRSVGCIGNNIRNAKNCIHCFDVYDESEDLSHVYIAGYNLKDARYCNHVGHRSELLYDCLITFDGSRDVAFSAAISTSQSIRYSWNCRGSRNLFGCVGLTNKEYCILNKPYSKEEYESLVSRIIAHMDEMPYTAQNGTRYAYGDFFPPEISLFAYNESVAQEYYPLVKEEALKKGFSWRDATEKHSIPTFAPESIPEDIDKVSDSITGEVFGCAHAGKCNEQCTEAFRIIPSELVFYKRLRIPLPILCPNCRHYTRFNQRNPFKLWTRKCQCAGRKSENGAYENNVAHFHGENHCTKEFETPYSPDRAEIVYCEQCYQTDTA